MIRTPAFQSWMLRFGAALMSGPPRSRSFIVLIFHRVLERPDPLLLEEPDALAFQQLMWFISSHFNVLPLREATERLRNGNLPSRTVCVTFDDGYANNCEIALPILNGCGIPATVFVAPGFLNGGCMFNDTVIEAVRGARKPLDLRGEGLDRYPIDGPNSRIRAIKSIIPKLKHLDPIERTRVSARIQEIADVHPPTDLMMSDTQIRKLQSSGIEIGAHTVSHPILTKIDLDQARREICQSKLMLEAITNSSVTTFAYPNGRPRQDYRAEHVDLVREAGFELALSTAPGAVRPRSDVFQLPRIAPWDKDLWRYGLRMAMTYRQRQRLFA